MTHTSHHDAPRHACANAVSGLTTRQKRTRRTLSCTLSAAKVQPTTTLRSSLHPAKSRLRTALQSIHTTNCASAVLGSTRRGPVWARPRTWRASTSSSEDATYITRRSIAGATTSLVAMRSHDVMAAADSPFRFPYAVDNPTLYMYMFTCYTAVSCLHVSHYTLK